MGRILPNAGLVARLQARVKASFYVDSAFLIIETGTGVFNDNNTETMETTEVPLDGCSFTDQPSMEKWKDYTDIQEIDGEIRYAGPEPTKANHVKVVGRFEGQTYKDKTFEIVGIRNRDAFGWVCALKAVSI